LQDCAPSRAPSIRATLLRSPDGAEARWRAGAQSGASLVLHGDDQVVPIGASAMLSSKLIKNATLKVYEGAPHGMCTTLKDRVNADLLAFIRT
jgi:pimeloyl-ACP methyl ester carboxylesterase